MNHHREGALLDDVTGGRDNGAGSLANRARMARALLREPELLHRIQADPGTRSLCIHCNKCMPTIYTGARCVLASPGRT